MLDPHQDQVDKNYAAFVKMLPELMQTRRGKFALMRDEQIIDFFDTPLDADTAGRRLYPNEPFSVQQVESAPVNLGFFSYASS